MAIYHTRVKTFSRANGHTSTAAAAYRAGLLIVDERTGITHDYRRRGGVVETRCFAPLDSPEWALDPYTLWSLSEAREGRKDSTVAREFEVSLPHELTDDQRSDLVADICRELVDRYRFAVQASIHSPPDDKGLNFHAHILATTRRMRPDGLSDKTRELDGGPSGRTEVEWVREMVAERINGSLEAAGIDARVDHRTLAAQSEAAAERGDFVAAALLAREPTKQVSKEAIAMRRKGAQVKAVKRNEAITNDNEAAFEALVAEFESQGRLTATSMGHSHVQAQKDLRPSPAERSEVVRQELEQGAHLWSEDFAKQFHKSLAATTKFLQHHAERLVAFSHLALFRSEVRDLLRALKRLKHDVFRFDRRMKAEDRAAHLRSQAEQEVVRFDTQHPHPGLWTRRQWAVRRKRRQATAELRRDEHLAAREATGPEAQREYQALVQGSAQALEQLSQSMLTRYPVVEDIEPVPEAEVQVSVSADPPATKTRTMGPK